MIKKFFSSNEKLKFNPNSHSPHMKIIKLIDNNSKVLDIGCASGYVAKELKKKNCYVAGIEIDKIAAKKAKKYCNKVILEDIEKINKLPFSKNFFDVIILSDILEHLKRPDKVLIKIKEYLAPEGFIISSIPNIGRLELRLKHLIGKFDYEDGGILSKSHLRFFTLKTCKSLFETSGYKIIDIDYTGLGSMLKVLPTWFAFQFLIKAKVKKS